jgi:Ca2+-binding RTX toxin-like protein
MDTAATDLSSLVIDTATMSGVTINGNAGAVASEAQVITGTNAADTVNAGTQNTTVNGGASDDTINGGTGNDNLNGDAGNDTIDAGAGNDTINGGAGADSLKGNSGNDTISGDAGNDDLLGDSGTDTLSGGDDDDILNGGADKDSLNGGAGVDFMIGGAGADTMTGGAGVDTFAYASAGVVTIAEDTAGANGVKEVQTVTISGTCAAGETITLTDTASETAAYTVLQGDSASDIAAGLKAAADTAAGGGTFDVFTATVSGAVITLTEAVAGGNDLAAVTSASTNAQAANTDASIAVASGTVSGYDVITDFNSSEDKILLGGSNALAGVAAASPTAGANAKISTNAVATFAETDDTLAEIIATLVADTTNVANNEVVTFEFDGNTYIYGAGGTAGGATDYMIELTGVTDLGTASISSGMLSFS